MKERDSYFDNAKFFLMVLVVFGHLLQPFIEDGDFYRDIYYTIFTFHMPAFILIAGFFSKKYQRPGYLLNCFKTFVPTYFIFQIIYSLYDWTVGGSQGFQIDFSIPHWSLWFLLSMFFWNLLLFIFGKIPPLAGVILAFLIAITAGYLPFINRELTLQRTLVFLPFFVLGFYLSPQVFKKIQNNAARVKGLVLLIGIYIFIQVNESLNKYWLFGSKPYDDFLSIPELGAIVRGIVLTLGVVGIFSFLSLIPTKKMFFTNWGRHTLTVYLLHGFLIRGLRTLNFGDFKINFFGFLLLLAGSFLLTAVLGSQRLENYRVSLKQFFKGIPRKMTTKD